MGSKRGRGGSVTAPGVEVNIPQRPICPPLTLQVAQLKRGQPLAQLRNESDQACGARRNCEVPTKAATCLGYCSIWSQATTLVFPELEGKQPWLKDNCGINQCGKPIVRGTFIRNITAGSSRPPLSELQFPETIEAGNRGGNTMRL